MVIPAKRYFLTEDEVMYLADYLLIYPCNVHLHLCYAFMHKKLKSYIIDENENAQKKGKISIYSFPIHHMTHDYTCDNFSKIVFKKTNVEKFKSDIDKFSILKQDRVASQDFCAPDNIEKIAPQIAFMLRKYASKMETDKFDEVEANECFYARDKEFRIRDAVAPHMQQNRPNWHIPHSALWPTDLSFSTGIFPPDFMLDVVLPQFRDALIRGGTTAPKLLAELIDSRFPGVLTDQKMGELVRPQNASPIKYHSVRQYGRNVRGKIKPK